MLVEERAHLVDQCGRARVVCEVQSAPSRGQLPESLAGDRLDERADAIEAGADGLAAAEAEVDALERSPPSL